MTHKEGLKRMLAKVRTEKGSDYHIEQCGQTILVTCQKYHVLVAIIELFREEGFEVKAGQLNGLEIVILQRGA